MASRLKGRRQPARARRRPLARLVVRCAWHEREEADRPGVTHTICPRCFEMQMSDLDAQRPSATSS